MLTMVFVLKVLVDSNVKKFVIKVNRRSFYE